MGRYKYAPAITVDETDTDRPLYKLIYLSRHPVGLKVFRDTHRKALEAQASYRSAKKAESRQRSSGMSDMFSNLTNIEPSERSAREMAFGEKLARSTLLELIEANPAGLRWAELWPLVLDACTITHGALGGMVSSLRSTGDIHIPEWQSNTVRRPKDEFRLFSAKPR